MGNKSSAKGSQKIDRPHGPSDYCFNGHVRRHELLGDPLFNILGPVAADVDNPESLKAIEEAKLSTTWISRYLNGGLVGLGIS